jgi:hypothetical protein
MYFSCVDRTSIIIRLTQLDAPVRYSSVFIYIYVNCHVVFVTTDGVSDNWILDLLTTYTHNSEPQAVTAPSLISTLYKSPQPPLSLFQPAVSSPVIPLISTPNSGELKSSLNAGSLPTVPFLHSLPYRTVN